MKLTHFTTLVALEQTKPSVKAEHIKLGLIALLPTCNSNSTKQIKEKKGDYRTIVFDCTKTVFLLLIMKRLLVSGHHLRTLIVE